MAELATLARPYAQALFEAQAVGSGGDTAWLEALGRIAQDPQLQKFAADPRVTNAQVLEVMVDVAGVALPPLAQNFLRTVIENRRLNALPEMAKQFRALKNAQSQSSDATIYSAFPIEAAALPDVVAALEQRFARKLNVRVEVQPALIGGVRVVVGDEVLDASVKARLEQMKMALTV